MVDSVTSVRHLHVEFVGEVVSEVAGQVGERNVRLAHLFFHSLCWVLGQLALDHRNPVTLQD